MSLDEEVVSAFLTPKNVETVYDQLFDSADSSAKMLRMSISDSLPSNYLRNAGIDISLEIEAAAAPGPKKILDTAIRHVTKGGETVPPKVFSKHFRNSKNWGLALLQEYFLELRKQVCGKTKKLAPLGQSASAALAALGTAICKFLGLSNALGMGIAVLVVTNAAWIGKVAFCKMTSPEQLTQFFS